MLTARGHDNPRRALLDTDRQRSSAATVSSAVRRSSSILAGLRTPLLVLALTAIAYGGFVYSRLSNRNWDWSYFVTAGNEFVNPDAVRTSLYIWPNAGYDGQFYYRLALNPLSSDREAYGIVLDNPTYRQQRILYPALAWAVTLGHVRFVPAALVLINLAALCALAWFAASLAQSSGRSPLWGLALALYPGFLLALSRDLTEILEAALLLGALWCLRRNWASAAAIALTLAVLARETAGFVVAMMALTYALDRWRRRTPSFPAYVFVVPGAVAAAWQVFLYYRWQALPLLSGQDKIRLPLAALWQFLSNLGSAPDDLKLLWSIELYLLALMLVLGLILVWDSSARPYEKLAWLGYTVLGLSFSGTIWVEDWGFMRILIDWYVLGVVVLLGARWRDTGPLFAVTSATGALWVGLVSRLA